MNKREMAARAIVRFFSHHPGARATAGEIAYHAEADAANIHPDDIAEQLNVLYQEGILQNTSPHQGVYSLVAI